MMIRSKKKKLFKSARVPAAFLLAAAFIMPGLPLGAAAVKEEAVYVRLSNGGSAEEIYVVNGFTFGGEQKITDYGDYSYVTNLSNADTLRMENGAVICEAGEGSLYYEGSLLNAELPWEFSIIYKLNGKEIPPEELGGKSGRLEMEIRSGFNPLGDRDFFDKY